ncbi:MAG: TonB-dependent receptor [Gammaproteobacteria bacterium]|nr:TonB-dependent receptor [Gammaproteobacteria bacterium]
MRKIADCAKWPVLAQAMLAAATPSSLQLARAADVSADEYPTLEAVVVTAERRAESIQEVPLSVTAISGDTLQKFGDLNFGDYAHTIPNLSFGTGSDFGVTNGRNVTIRGITGGRYRNGQTTTSFYVDDTPVPLSLDPRVLDLERIEVLRGPQGTLFGSSAMGGTVRIITRAPDAQSSRGVLDVQGFDINHGGAGYDLSGAYDMPLIADELAVKVSAYSAYKPGIFTRRYGIATTPGYTVPASQPPGEVTHVGSDTEFGGMVALTYTPTAVSGLSVTPMVIYQRSRSNGLPLADYDTANLIQVRPLNVGEATEDSWSFSSLTAKYATGFGSFISSSTWFHRQSFDNEDGTESVAVVFGSAALPPLSTTLASTYLASPSPSYVNLTSFTQELRFESSFGGPVQVIAGGYYTHGKSHTIQQEYTPYDSTGAPFFWEDVPNSNNEVAAFADLTYSPIRELELSAGLREATLGYKHAYVADGWINGGPSDSPSSHREHSSTPRYTAKYQITRDAMVYANAAKGYRIGGANSTLPPVCYGQGPANAGSFSSYSLWSYELGSKNTLFEGRLKTRVAAYRIDWKNMQQSVLLQCTYSITENAGTATSTGAEIEADVAPVRGLNLSFGAGYDNAKITSVPAGSTGFVVGQPLNGVPKLTASLLGEYTVPTAFGGAFVRGQYSFTGRSVSYANDPTGRDRASYSLVDLHLGVSKGAWEASLFAKNLFDVRANLGDEQSEISELPGRPRWLIAQPRTIGLEIRCVFNDK